MKTMLKKYLAFFAFLLINGTTYPQAITSKYRGFTFDEMMEPLLIMQQANNQITNSINSLYDYIVDVLGHDIDNQLRQELNQELKHLDNVAKKLYETGHIGNARNSYQIIRRNVQKEIANYNNRMAQERERRAKQEAEEKVKPQNWSGTGFALKNGYVVTNYHVIDEAKSIKIKGVNGDFNKSYTATVVGNDKINDLALLKISDPSFQGFEEIPYAITSTTSEVGEDIFVLGYPLISTMGDEIKLTTGVISSKTGFQGDVALYQISAPIQPGNSGGPLFDKKGNIIGVICAIHAGAENVGYAIKSSYLQNLIESCASTSIIPTNNTVSTLPLTNKVKLEKNFVFFIHCSSPRTPSYNNSSYDSDQSNSSSNSEVPSSINNGPTNNDSAGDVFVPQNPFQNEYSWELRDNIRDSLASNVAIKTNILADGFLSPNIGIEVGIAPQWTLNLSGQVNFWTINRHHWHHWLVQSEARLWLRDHFTGHFLGFQALGGMYNFGNINFDVKFLGSDFSKLAEYRFQGWGIGGGIAYGYAWILGRHWNFEAEISIGYIYTHYDVFSCSTCNRAVKRDVPHHYVGPTKTAINLVYLF